MFAELVITELFAIWPHVFLKHTVKEHLLKCFQVVLLKKEMLTGHSVHCKGELTTVIPAAKIERTV